MNFQCDEPDDQMVVPCSFCRIPILSFWKHNGGLLRGEYVLIADSLMHPKCWRRYMEHWGFGL